MELIKKIQKEQDNKTLYKVLKVFNSKDFISVSLIQRKCKCGYNSAYRVLNYMIENGMVEKYMEMYKRI